MTARGFVGSCVFCILSAGTAFGQEWVIVPVPLPFFIPAPVVAAPPPAEVGSAQAPPTSERSNYPPESARKMITSPRVVHERHYISANANISHYRGSRPKQEYGPETVLVVRDYFITDDPPKRPPPPAGSADDRKSRSGDAPPPRNSTESSLEEALRDSSKSGASGGVKAPDPSAADNGIRANAQYPPTEEERFGPPTPLHLLRTTPTTVSVASRNGGTPMAEMEVNFVDLAGRFNDVKGRTDGKGQFKRSLAPSRWQVFLVIDADERRSLGVVLVKPTPGEPFKLQF